MSSNNQTEQLFEVAIRVDRYPLPPYYETFLNNLTAEQVKNIINTLTMYGEQYFVFSKDKQIKTFVVDN